MLLMEMVLVVVVSAAAPLQVVEEGIHATVALLVGVELLLHCLSVAVVMMI